MKDLIGFLTNPAVAMSICWVCGLIFGIILKSSPTKVKAKEEEEVPPCNPWAWAWYERGDEYNEYRGRYRVSSEKPPKVISAIALFPIKPKKGTK